VSIHEKIVTPRAPRLADTIESRGTAIYDKIVESGARFGEVIAVHSQELRNTLVLRGSVFTRAAC